jgi:hypothetical protein
MVRRVLGRVDCFAAARVPVSLDRQPYRSEIMIDPTRSMTVK